MKKKAIITLVLSLALLIVTTSSTKDSLTVDVEIDESIYVLINLRNMNSTIFDYVLLHESIFNGSTIPRLIVRDYQQKGLTRIFYYDQNQRFDFSTNSINVSFYLTGLDVLSFTFNRDVSAKIYQFQADWRKIYCNITDLNGETLLILDFNEYFGKPLDQWIIVEHIDLLGRSHTCLFYNHTNPADFEAAFRIILPEKATDVRYYSDTVIFSIPVSMEDYFINSPFLILIAIIGVDLAAIINRRISRMRSLA